MKFILLFVFILSGPVIFAQQSSKEDKKTITDLKKTITYLADDKLEGRRTGTAGEKLAYKFISKKFKKNGLTPSGDNSGFLQAFEVNDGKELKENNFLKFGPVSLVLHVDYFPMPYSPDRSFDGILTGLEIGLLDVNTLITENKDNPHFDLKESILGKIKDAEKNGSKMFLILDTASPKETFDRKDKTPVVEIPVFYLTSSGVKKYQAIAKDTFGVSYHIEMAQKIRTGHNVVGYINNNANGTIILGAHYDHLGYGEDHNSLYSGATPMIHNGADDNASGTAALIALSKWLKNSSFKKYNYLVVAFSGEELGLYGSKYFTEHSPVDLHTVDYMINMDMVGRLNDSTHGLTIGGYGTSPEWSNLILKDDNYFKIKFDSSGSGPSDHTSFYRKDIPVLFFFTGTHKDYHKPSDDADKINYSGELAVISYIKRIIEATNGKEKLTFSKTKEAASMGRSSFKVTLGIMIDYTYSGNGVLVEGVSDGRPAQKAGINAGDVLFQLGEHGFSDVQTYMQALNKFNKGESTNVKFKRNGVEMQLPVTF